jgi:predicted Zn finger-like uncharacterized protein
MIVQCKSCSRKFVVRDQDIPEEGRAVQCGYCSVTWHQRPIDTPIKKATKPKKTISPSVEVDESPSVDNIKASDGKTYKFLGSQWAELLPSGKTGLFAKKKIGSELDKLTGRKVKRISKKKNKKIKEFDPSSEATIVSQKLPDIYKTKQGLGFFGYVFLTIIIGFSIIGILKTFEDDLLNYIPNAELVFILLDEQLEFLAESVKNIIVLVGDLVNSY